MNPDDNDQVVSSSGTAYEQTCSLLSRHARLPKLLVIPELSSILVRTESNVWKLRADVQGVISALESKGVKVALIDGAGVSDPLRQLGLDKIIILPSMELSLLRQRTGINGSDVIRLQSTLDVAALDNLLTSFQASSTDEKGF